MTYGTISVLLVDDHAIVREGYKRLLERGDIAVVGEAADGEEALRLFGQLAPQVVVMDISLPGISGIEVTRRMLSRAPKTRVLVFSMHTEVIYANRALQAGACGYLTKVSAPGVLVDAVHTVAKGGRYMSADIAQALAASASATAGENGGLSAREFEVLRLLVRGQSLEDIARAIGITPKTAANYQSLIKQKLGVDNTVQLLERARLLIGP